MSCAGCNLPIEAGAKIMDAPCCDRKYHSACAIQKLGMILIHSSTAACDCGAIIFQYHYHTAEPVPDALLNTPAILAEIKDLKKRNAAAAKSMVGFKKYLKEKKTEFKTLIEPNVSAIELAKQNMLTEIKASETFKECRRLKTTSQLLMGKFQTKHNLGRRQMRTVLKQKNYGSYRWRWGVVRLLKNEFSLRL